MAKLEGTTPRVVAVGLGPRDELGADRAARAGAVIDDELLADVLRQVDRVKPRDAIGRAAGRERHDQAHRAPASSPAGRGGLGEPPPRQRRPGYHRVIDRILSIMWLSGEIEMLSILLMSARAQALRWPIIPVAPRHRRHQDISNGSDRRFHPASRIRGERRWPRIRRRCRAARRCLCQRQLGALEEMNANTATCATTRTPLSAHLLRPLPYLSATARWSPDTLKRSAHAHVLAEDIRSAATHKLPEIVEERLTALNLAGGTWAWSDRVP